MAESHFRLCTLTYGNMLRLVASQYERRLKREGLWSIVKHCSEFLPQPTRMFLDKDLSSLSTQGSCWVFAGSPWTESASQENGRSGLFGRRASHTPSRARVLTHSQCTISAAIHQFPSSSQAALFKRRAEHATSIGKQSHYGVHWIHEREDMSKEAQKRYVPARKRQTKPVAAMRSSRLSCHSSVEASRRPQDEHVWQLQTHHLAGSYECWHYNS